MTAKNKGKKIAVTTLVGLTVFTAMAGSVGAEPLVTKSNDVNLTIESGGLHLKTSDITDFESVTLGTKEQVLKTSFKDKFNVQDLRGTQAGWKLQVSASQFTADADKVLPKGSLALTGVSKVTQKGVGSLGTPTAPQKSFTDSKTIDEGAVTVVDAGKGTGMGEFDIDQTVDGLAVTVDASSAKVALEGSTTYTSTLTWDLVEAP